MLRTTTTTTFDSCLCVCCSFPLHYMTFAHLLLPSLTFSGLREPSRTFSNLLEPSRTFSSLLEPSRTFSNLLEPSRTYLIHVLGLICLISRRISPSTSHGEDGGPDDMLYRCFDFALRRQTAAHEQAPGAAAVAVVVITIITIEALMTSALA